MSPADLEARADDLERLLAAYVARGELVGAVCALSDGTRRAVRAVGHAHRETGQRMRTDTILRVHSLSKPLMAAAFSWPRGLHEAARAIASGRNFLASKPISR